MQLDMNPEQLKEYTGSTPRPADFDAYWERALKEMHAVDPQVELIPAAFQSPVADCFDMYFTGTKGARIYAKLLIPKNRTAPGPAVLQFHGYCGSSGDWSQYLVYAASGFVVAAMDVRGQGGKSEDVGGVKGTTQNGSIIRGLSDHEDNLLFRQNFLDTALLAKIVMDMDLVDETRVGAFGGSQGGGLTLACAALEPRIKRIAPRVLFLCDYKRVWEMDLAKNAYGELKDYFRKFDPRHEHEDEIFTQLGYIDVQFLAPRIKADTIFFTGLMDEVCPPSSQFAAYNKMTCNKKMYIYPDFAHEDFPDASDIIYEFMLGL